MSDMSSEPLVFYYCTLLTYICNTIDYVHIRLTPPPPTQHPTTTRGARDTSASRASGTCFFFFFSTVLTSITIKYSRTAHTFNTAQHVTSTCHHQLPPPRRYITTTVGQGEDKDAKDDPRI